MLYDDRNKNLKYSLCLSQQTTLKEGLYLEFGVRKGATINFSSSILKDKTFYGFDSFIGLPEDWSGMCTKGAFNLSGTLPVVNSNVELIAGWFENTLPKFLKENSLLVDFVHIDSDIYSSAKTILEHLKSRITTGTIIVFDEFFNYPTWKYHEYKAFQEFVEDSGIKYKYVSFGMEQATVQVL